MRASIRLKNRSAFKLRFLPGATGPSGTMTVNPDTITGAPGSDASVANTGTPEAAILQFTIPRGNTGQAATVAVGSTTTGSAGSSASVVNSGTSAAAVLEFTIPRGNTGNAATVAVGTTTTGAAGTSATVTNVGTSAAAVFNFTIPRGQDGVSDGDKGDIVVASLGTAWTIGANKVTLGKLAQIATARFLGRVTAGTGDVEALTKTQMQSALDLSAGLLSLSGQIFVADKLPYSSGVNTFALTDFTALARTVLGRATSNLMLQDLKAPWELVTSVAVSGSPASIDFTGLSGSLEHRLIVSGIKPATNDTSAILQVQTGGSTWQTTGYVYGGRIQGPGGGADTGSSVDSYSGGVVLNRVGAGNAVGNATGYSVSGEIAFVPADANQTRRFRAYMIYNRSSDGVEIPIIVGGSYGITTSAITGVRLILGSGNWANVGKVDLIRRVS